MLHIQKFNALIQSRVHRCSVSSLDNASCTREIIPTEGRVNHQRKIKLNKFHGNKTNAFHIGQHTHLCIFHQGNSFSPRNPIFTRISLNGFLQNPFLGTRISSCFFSINNNEFNANG